jgi:hypothetical protein
LPRPNVHPRSAVGLVAILGAQIVGRHGVDKRIDIIATAIAGGMTADRLADLELGNAPPFSSAKDPVNMLGYMSVAEILRSEIPLLRDLGLVADWKLISGNNDFFAVTKTIHNGLQGAPGGLSSSDE